MNNVEVALKNILDAISINKNRRRYFRAPFDSSIDWFIDSAERSEELPESGIYLIRNEVKDLKIVGVDGSSRRFSSPYGGFVIATIAISWGSLVIGDYPPLYPYLITIPSNIPFIATYSSMNVSSDLILTESPSGNPYEDESNIRVSLADIAHEIRTELETYGLRLALAGLRRLGNGIIILDGPLYQRPWKTELKRHPVLREDWKVLTRERVNVIKDIWDNYGIPIVSSVKRLEKSTYIVRMHSILLNYLKKPFPLQRNDVAESFVVADEFVRENKISDVSPILIGPFLIEPLKLGVPEDVKAPDIVYSYLVIPSIPYVNRIDDIPKCVLRLEVTKEVYKKYGLDIFRNVVSDLLISKGLFASQFYADNRCKKTSRILFSYLCREAIYRGIELSYDTRMSFMYAGGEEIV